MLEPVVPGRRYWMCNSLVRIVNRSVSFNQARKGGNYKGKTWWGGAKVRGTEEVWKTRKNQEPEAEFQ